MAKPHLVRPCVAVIVAALAIVPAAHSQYAPDKGAFVLAGKEHKLFPREKLIARGLPPPEIPDEQNAAWIYIDAMNAAVELSADLHDLESEVIASGKWPEGEAGQRMSDWLDKNAEAVALARKAGAMQQYHMPLTYDGETDSLVAAMMPTMGPMRSLAKMMALSSARARSTNPDIAIDDAVTVQRLAHHTAQGSTLIEGLVGMAIGELGEKSLRWSIEDGNLSSDKLAAVSAELDKLAATQPDWERMMRAEEKLSEAHIDDIMDLTGGLIGLLNPYSTFAEKIESNPDGWELLSRRLKRVYLPDRLMKKHSRSYYDRLLAATRDDDGAGGIKQTDEELIAAVPAWNMIGRMMLPSLSRAHFVTQLRRSNFQRTRVAVAAAAYKKARGNYPAKLADLTPAFLADVPKDPLTGLEVTYSVAADGRTHTGLEPIVGDKAKELYARRNAQAEARRADATHPWRLLLKEYTDRYQFDEAQRTAADAIVRDLEARVAAQIKVLAGESKSDPGLEKELTQELTRRLDDLPTAAQRAAAKK